MIGDVGEESDVQCLRSHLISFHQISSHIPCFFPHSEAVGVQLKDKAFVRDASCIYHHISGSYISVIYLFDGGHVGAGK